MTEVAKPVPVASSWSRPFWHSLREGRFVLQRCNDCNAFQGYPRVFCVQCYSDNLGWVEASGKGSIYTYTTIVSNPPSTFVDDLPYTLAIVTLDEGPRFLAQLLDIAPADIHCDMAVELVLREVTKDLVMPAFRPYEDAG